MYNKKVARAKANEGILALDFCDTGISLKWLFLPFSVGSIPSGVLDHCSFEDASICNFTQEGSDVFDWTGGRGATASSNTGPSTDHTYGTNQGKIVQGRYIMRGTPCERSWEIRHR
jgi:hypothetical protein